VRGRRACVQRAALALLALGCASCLASIADRVAEVRAKLIGVKARDLNSCVGVPFSVDEDGETEYLTYRWFDAEESDPFDDPIARRRFPGDDPDVLGRAEPVGRDGKPKTERERPPLGVAYCELIFEVREGRVQSVEVEGRRANGLNDDVDCISKAERCFKS
jgi:hypothetical protein